MKNFPVLWVLLVLLFLNSMALAQADKDSLALVDTIAMIRNSPEADTLKAKKLLSLYKHYRDADPGLALLAAENAYEFSSQKNLEYYKARSLGFTGSAYYALDRYAKALANYLQALQYYEKLGLKSEQGVILTNIGNVFLDQELPEQALTYYHQALAIDKDLKSDRDIATDLLNIGSAYSVTPKTDASFKTRIDSAYLFCMQALQMAEQLKDTIIYSQCLANLGIIENEQGKSDSALKHITDAEMLFEKLDLESNRSVLYLNLGDIYYDRKDIAQAGAYYTKALDNARSLESIDDERLAYQGLSRCAEAVGDTPSALKYLKKYGELNDTIFSIRSIKKQTQLLLNYELEKKEALISRQRAQRNFFIGGFIAVIILSFIMLRLYRQKNKSNKQLSEALRNLEETQAQLIHQEKMASLGTLMAGIAHEIQNPLNFVTNFSDSSLEIIKEVNDASTEEEKQELIKELTMNIEKISSHGKRADSIIKSMLRHSHGNSEEKQPTNLNKLCDEFLMLAYHSVRASFPDFNCAIEKKFQPDLPKVNLMAQEFTRVMLNLFTNAFHALKERQLKDKSFSPSITVTTQIENQVVKILVRDNGTGIPEQIKNKIFQPFFTTKKSGEGTGLGLSISYDIIKAHGGELTVNSKEGEFTEFTITLPA